MAHAQAWVDEPNAFSASFGYNFAFSDRILESGDADPIDPVPITHHVFNVGLEYVTPLEGLAVSASLPMILVRWDEENAGAGALFGGHGDNDDGAYHFAPSDLRLSMRYNPLVYLDTPLAASIIFGGTIPTHEYETQGFAAIGRNLYKLHFGLAFGATFSPFLPNLYLHAQYEFSLVQRYETDDPATAEYVQNHSDASFQIGYFILESLEIHAAVDARIAHGGFDFVDYSIVSQTVRDHHDPLLRENIVVAGGGVGWSPVEDFSITAYFRIFAFGTNTRDAHLVGLGMSYRIL